MRSYGKARWEAAQAGWKDGEPWREEWREWRQLAAEQGIPEAPQGGRWDSWDDDHPSEIALVVRAIRESPEWLRAAIIDPTTHSWAAVVAVVVRQRQAMADSAVEERGSAADPNPEEARLLWERLSRLAGTDPGMLGRTLQPSRRAP